ncbi:MAG TPA: L,D-transpeptidase family protein [Puia sp.]|nr:L,D-transpeptidase family protein [Puia sp.]
MPDHIANDLEKTLDFISQNKGKLNDTVQVSYIKLDDSIYNSKSYSSFWNKDEKWLPLANSLYEFIENSKEYGLFPDDYHYNALSFIRRVLVEDSIAKKNAVIWARADILLTDAFFKLAKDLKQGRFAYDSVTLRTDTLMKDSVLTQTLNEAIQSGSIDSTLTDLEPKLKGYDSLRAYLKNFLATAKFKPYTYLLYPYKDSITFFNQLEKRLFENETISSDSLEMDTAQFVSAIKKFQKKRGLRITGHISESVVDELNNSDIVKFKRIAVNLDRYKLLPDTLPHTYIWVNLPSFMLQVYDDDTVAFESRIIVGDPKTRTPLLTSQVTNFITFPQWTVPLSIIFKEMLPKIQQNIDYLRKENLMVVDKDDNILDPKKIKWSKLSKKHFPYYLKQQQGDNNSLGVIKFNFRNKYSVYMHDTNVRWMFGKAFRALSHGCVRVKEWQKMSDFLVRNDTMRYHPDTLRAWIKRQEKHVVSGFQRVPVFLRYFDCVGINGRVKFYDDIYEEDKFLREKYFGNKSVN